MTRDDILALYPEFARFTHRLAFVSDRQNALLLARLARNALRLSNGCIVWTSSCNNDGYGRMNLWMVHLGTHFQFVVHRVAWQLAHGKDIPSWREIAHECNTPPCFNPLHLKLQRMPDNRRDSAKNTQRKLARHQAVARLRAFSAEVEALA